MSSTCDDLTDFVAGELEPERAALFRSHLATCEQCRAALVDALQLHARLVELPAVEVVSPAQHAAAPAPQIEGADVGVGSAVPRAVRPGLGPRPRPRWNRAQWGGAVLAATAAAAGLVVYFTRPPARDPFEGVVESRYDVRFAYAGVAKHRPARDVNRGAGGSSVDPFSHDDLARLEANDPYGLAIAEAYNGKPLPAVAGQLSHLAQTPEVRNDRAAVDLLLGDSAAERRTDSLEPVLEELGRLATRDDIAGRAASWNYALALGRLELPLSAARAFRAIAAQNEPGWSADARQRADRFDRQAMDRAKWERAKTEGQKLLQSLTPIPAELVRQVPSIARAYFYKAVRVAPDRDHVLALRPMAAELDNIAGGSLLSDYVERVARLDFARRAPLARAYAQLLADKKLTPSDTAALSSDTPASDVVDIVMGAMSELNVIPEHIDAYRRMADATNDPWFHLILLRNAALAERKSGREGRAEAILSEGSQQCTEAVAVSCLWLIDEQVRLYKAQYRLDIADGTARRGAQLARSTGDWGWLFNFLQHVADVARLNSSIETARVYANELVLMSGNQSDEYHREAHMLLANIAIRDLNGRTARRELALAMQGQEPDLAMANVLADAGRLDAQRDDLAQLRSWLNKLRSGALPPARRAYADALEGRLVIETDRTAGIALLDQVIAATDAPLPDDVVLGREVRASTFSVLALDAADHRDHARALALLARQIGAPSPGPCTVAVVVEDARSAFVVRGNDGEFHSRVSAKRTSRELSFPVPDELLRELDGCRHIRVIASGVLQGQPGVLPARLAWSYVTGGADSEPGRDLRDPRVVIIADVTPPKHLQLPRLPSGTFDAMPGVEVVSGASATPSRVLAEIADATEIQFHTHALENGTDSQAAFLALSPDVNGRYALTAETIRGIELRRHPVVVLAACDSAHAARYQHVPWSLPSAFRAAGASLVFATATEIPDREARRFFDGLMRRVRGGVDPAVALRDERQAALTANPASWAADVMLFE
jgi:hypothetical protein